MQLLSRNWQLQISPCEKGDKGEKWFGYSYLFFLEVDGGGVTGDSGMFPDLVIVIYNTNN